MLLAANISVFREKAMAMAFATPSMNSIRMGWGTPIPIGGTQDLL